VPLLCELRVVERLVRRFEIGAAVLPVGVEEERVEACVEVVMMGCVAPRAGARIELAHAASEVAHQRLRAGPAGRPQGAGLGHHHREHVRDRALFDDQRAVHIGFAEAQFGIDDDTEFRGA